MAKAGDIVPEIVHFSSATASDQNRTLASFAMHTASGAEINFCISIEGLGALVSHALNIASKHAQELRRGAIHSGAVTAIESVPESLTVSFNDVTGGDHPRLVAIFGDLTLAFHVDAELLQEVLAKFGGRASARPTNLPHISRAGGAYEIKLPTHSTSKPPFDISALPIKWAPHVGYITVLWGRFETRLDELLEVLAAANRTTLPEYWQRQNFTKRRALFLQEMRSAFAAHSSLLRYCELMSEDAAKIHLVRNLLVHGKLHGAMDADKYVLIAESEHKGKPIQARFQEPELLTLYYETGNLCGRIAFIFDPDDSPGKPQPFSSDEKRFLRELIQRNSPSPPTQPTPPPPPPPSGG